MKTLWRFLQHCLKISIYHVMPMLSTTILLFMLIDGGMTWTIFISYLGLSLFSCGLMALSILRGK